jgi:PTS system nitrogen regulatory IIA component
MLDVPEAKIADALFKCEEVGSTGTGDGVALPHARMADVKRPFGMLVRLRQAIDFDAGDGKPVNLVFLLLTPATSPGEQLNALACAARALRKPDVLLRLQTAARAEELLRR